MFSKTGYNELWNYIAEVRAKIQADEDAKRRAEEEKRRAEEDAKRQAEAEKLRAEEEKRKAMEEAYKNKIRGV